MTEQTMPESHPETPPETSVESGAETPAETPAETLADTGRDVPPDHLAIDPRSPYFDADKLQRGVAIRFKGRQRTDIEEYCISEGWVRVQAGKALDRRGRPLTIQLKGPVQAWYEDTGEVPPEDAGSSPA